MTPRGARYLCWPLAHFRVQMKVRTQLLQLPVQTTALPAWLRQIQLSEESPGKSMFSSLSPELDFHTVTSYHILLSTFLLSWLSLVRKFCMLAPAASSARAALGKIRSGDLWDSHIPAGSLCGEQDSWILVLPKPSPKVGRSSYFIFVLLPTGGG